MVLQIALGVFLGLAAWTYRADLGSVFLLLFFVALAVALILWFVKSLYGYYAKLKFIQSAKKLASEIVQLGLVEISMEKALFLGLQNQTEYDFFILNARLKDYKISLLNNEEDEFQKIELIRIANEAIEDFKVHRSIEKIA